MGGNEMAKKKIIKAPLASKSAKPAPKKMKNSMYCGCCSDKKWNLVPLRFALGLMFLAAGLPKLFSLIAGGNQISMFFAGLGIPLPVFFAWTVAIVEIVGGLFLLAGFMIWWTGLVLGILMLVALITTTINPLNWLSLMMHLVFITALVALMHGSRYFSVNSCCSCCRMKE
jgi:putative oxidoreductase